MGIHRSRVQRTAGISTSPEEAFDVLKGFITPQALERWRKSLCECLVRRIRASISPRLNGSPGSAPNVQRIRVCFTAASRGAWPCSAAFGGESGPSGSETFARHRRRYRREL